MTNLEELREELYLLFSTERGKKVIEDLKDMYIYTSSFNTDALTMAFNEGQKEFILEIISIINNKEKER